MKKYLALFLTLIIFHGLNTAYALDGKRKGFIIGGGIGIGLFVNNYSLDTISSTNIEPAFIGDFRIGYAPSNSLEIYLFSAKYSGWYHQFDEDSGLNAEENILNVFWGIEAAKYLGGEQSKLYLIGGLGYSIIEVTSHPGLDIAGGLGIFGGIGYEFKKHWSVRAELLYNRLNNTDSELDLDLHSVGVRISVNVLGY